MQKEINEKCACGECVTSMDISAGAGRKTSGRVEAQDDIVRSGESQCNVYGLKEKADGQKAITVANGPDGLRGKRTFRKSGVLSFDYGVACLMDATGPTELDSASLHSLDCRARNIVMKENYTLDTFQLVSNYLLLRYLSPYTSEGERLNIRSAMIYNLFMLQSCMLNAEAPFGSFRKIYRDPVMAIEPDSLLEFNPTHKVLFILNHLKHYYLLCMFGWKARVIFQRIIEAIEPLFDDMAIENRLYIGSLIKELKQCHTWPKGHIATESIFARIPSERLERFDRLFSGNGFPTCRAYGRRYMATKEKLFIPL